MTTMDRDRLLERLRGLEWEDFEVKEASGGVPRSAYETVSAFANTRGGWLVFGVREVRKRFVIVGVQDPDALQNDFLGGCRSTDKFSRPVEVRPHHIVFGDATVLAFHVAPATRHDKPVRVRVDKAWFAYIRVGARDQRCTAEEEGRFLRDATVESFDAQVMPHAGLEDLDEASIRWVRGLYAQRNPENTFSGHSHGDFLEELGLLTDGRVTHAAALFVGRRRLIGRLKPAGIVDFRHVRLPWQEEVPAHRYDDRLLAEGNLVETLQAVLGKMLNLVPNPFRLEARTLRREAQAPEYPALREALVNLLVHQDYADQHRTARILWYEDRTIFDNPGDSFVELSAMLDGGASDLRNPRIARLMRLIGYADQVGTGIGTIVRTWRSVDRVPPVVVNDPGRKTYALSLGWRSALPFHARGWADALGVDLPADEARLLAWLGQAGVVHRATARLATGGTTRATRELLDDLLRRGLIEHADEAGDRIRLAAAAREVLLAPVGDAGSARARTEPVAEPAATEPSGMAPQVDPQVAALVRVLVAEMSRDALQAAVGLVHRAHFVSSWLTPALEAGLVELTIPDKPRSPRQRYRLTDTGRALRRVLLDGADEALVGRAAAPDLEPLQTFEAPAPTVQADRTS